MDYVGTRWFKCDFHVHTFKSNCFEDENKSVERWVGKALDEKVNCIAVTDHNTPEGVNEVIEYAKDKDIIIFPGVELTCDTSKIHVLALFDVNKKRDDIFHFLSKCGVNNTDFGKDIASSEKSIFEIIGIANECGCILIPAHIDEFSGLEKLSHDNLIKLYENPAILGVQVVHKEFNEISSDEKIEPELTTAISQKRCVPEETVRGWYKVFNTARQKELALLTFSDNPLNEGSSKHGVDGIGSSYTWIKMKSEPNLESLRQALLLPEHRIRNCWEVGESVYSEPDIWLKSLSINDSIIATNLNVEFNPQLNTIIGGRGSGKSGILRIIRGILCKTEDLREHDTIYKDFDEFYCRVNKTKKGIMTAKSKVELILKRNKTYYKIISDNIHTSDKQDIKIYEMGDDELWEPVEDGYLSLFEVDIYSQKQIFEIADRPKALMNRIDKNISPIKVLQEEKVILEKGYMEKRALERRLIINAEKRNRLLLEKKDVERSISLYDQSGFASLMEIREKFINDKQIIDGYIERFKNNEEELTGLGKLFEQFSKDQTNEDLDEEVVAIIDEQKKEYCDIAAQVLEISQNMILVHKNFEQKIKLSDWRKNNKKNSCDLEKEKNILEEKGIDSIEGYQKLLDQKRDIEVKIQKLEKNDSELVQVRKEIEGLYNEYLELLKNISKNRSKFFKDHIKGEKVKVSIKPFRGRESYEEILRKILKVEDGYDEEINLLNDICFLGFVEKTINDVRETIINLREGERIEGYSGYFINRLKKLEEEDIDKLYLYMPEDEIEISYKPNGSNIYKPLNTASAGQKTTAILTIILSYGTTPLILDQPEDDLDNKLVYELIVDRLLTAKESRQLIIVTHNANIPVNGDSENIISMDSGSKEIEILETGSIDDLNVKKEVCDTMEGTEAAFEMRARRYGKINEI